MVVWYAGKVYIACLMIKLDMIQNDCELDYAILNLISFQKVMKTKKIGYPNLIAE